MNVAKFLAEVSDAIEQVHKKWPSGACMACGMKRDFRIVSIGRAQGFEAGTIPKMEITGLQWVSAGWTEVRIYDKDEFSSHSRLYCPDCSEKKGLA